MCRRHCTCSCYHTKKLSSPQRDFAGGKYLRLCDKLFKTNVCSMYCQRSCTHCNRIRASLLIIELICECIVSTVSLYRHLAACQLSVYTDTWLLVSCQSVQTLNCLPAVSLSILMVCTSEYCAIIVYNLY